MKKIIYMKPVNMIFNCSPSLGIIDSWMPIMSSLRERLPHANFIFVAPKLRSIRELNLSSSLHQKAAVIFDQVVFKADSDQWYSTDSFDNAIKFAHQLDRSLVIRVMRKIRLWGIQSHLTVFQSWVNKKRFNSLHFDFLDLDSSRGVLLFDISEIEKPYAEYIRNYLVQMPKYSLSHGLSPSGVGGVKQKLVKPSLRLKNVRALISSRIEEKFHMEKYGLAKSQLWITGIPRHENGWLQKIQRNKFKENFKSAPYLSEKFIFVIGRPANESYFPKKRKIETLIDIRKVAEKYGLNIVVKTHPKEHDASTYVEVFGSMSEGLTFNFSDFHPLILGKNCSFAVSLYSGVAVDMVRLGTPVIEKLDLRGLQFADNAESLRDADYEPVFSYRYLGFVLGASDSKTFENQVERVMKHREEVIAEQRAAYYRVYPTIPDINEKIAAEIAAAVG